MEAQNLALVQGWRDTRSTLAAWQARPWQVLRGWMGGSLVVGLLLLAAVWVVATLADPAPIYHVRQVIPWVWRTGRLSDVAHILARNSLVLALHALACVAGFIARSSLPLELDRHSGRWRGIHDKAGPLAVAFVVGAVSFSLCAQAYLLGTGASSLAFRLGLSPGLLLGALAPHAVLELTALFLPLAAWIGASRRGDWHQLLAATLVTVAVAVPMLVAAALIEVFVSPLLIRALVF